MLQPVTAPPPSPRALPLLGHLHLLGKNPLHFMLQLGRTYGDMSCFRLAGRHFYFVNHPELIKQVLQDSNFVRTPLTRRLMASFLGEGVFSQEGTEHLRQRRLMQPAFHRERLATYGRTMVEATYQALEGWHPGEARELTWEMMRLTFSIVARTLFSTDTGEEAKAVDEAFSAVQRNIKYQYRLHAALPDWVPLIQLPGVRRGVQELRRLTQGLVARRREEGEDRGDLLSMLLLARDEDGSRMSDEQVCAQVLSLLFAGHETTANTLCWALYLLSRHPQVARRLHEEVRTQVGERRVAVEDLPRLPYVEQVVSEALRLYPPAIWAERVNARETRLGEWVVPAGMPVVVSVYVTHRDSRFFERPEEFLPERFAPERAGSIPRYAYLPFGAGVHMCIGNHFALMEARLVLAALAQRFFLEVPAEYQPEPLPAITLGIRNGLPARVRPASEVGTAMSPM
jgi:cytochrome P450